MNTDKQPQTVYVPTKDGSLIEVCSRDGMSSDNVKKLESVYIFTHEELEALKVKWQMEAISDNISGNHNEPCSIHSPEMNGICMVCKEKIFTPTT